MTRILVTGGSGFIGQHLTSALVAQGHQVRVLDRQPPARAVVGADYVEGSVLDAKLVHTALNDIDEVYHLAGLPGMWMPDKNDFHAVNFGGTETVIAVARKRNIRRFVHCSTESILFGSTSSDTDIAEETLLGANDMPGPYTRSKMLADQHAMQAAADGFPVIVACPTMPIGPHDHNLTPPAAMLQHFLSGRFQPYLDFIVNLVDVRDVAAGLVLTMERGQIGHRYVLGGDSMALKEILRLMAQVSGRRQVPIPIPARVAIMASSVMELIADHVTRRPPSGTAEGVRIALRATALPSGKAQRELGYAPGPVEPALRETILHLLDASPKDARSLRTSDQYGA